MRIRPFWRRPRSYRKRLKMLGETSFPFRLLRLPAPGRLHSPVTKLGTSGDATSPLPPFFHRKKIHSPRRKCGGRKSCPSEQFPFPSPPLLNCFVLSRILLTPHSRIFSLLPENFQKAAKSMQI